MDVMCHNDDKILSFNVASDRENTANTPRETVLFPAHNLLTLRWREKKKTIIWLVTSEKQFGTTPVYDIKLRETYYPYQRETDIGTLCKRDRMSSFE